MAQVVLLLLELVLTVGASWWIVSRDTRRLSGVELSRAWNRASFWVAVVVFPPLCIPVHFARTRRSWKGLAIGLAWMLAVLMAVSAVTSGLALVLDPASR